MKMIKIKKQNHKIKRIENYRMSLQKGFTNSPNPLDDYGTSCDGSDRHFVIVNEMIEHEREFDSTNYPADSSLEYD